jgi:hypothetical protein
MSRILITGSREWEDYNTIARAISVGIETLHAENPNIKVITIVHGGARGADRMAGRFVDQARDFLKGKGITIREEVHPVTPEEWKRSRGAGLARNEKMVALGADLAIAFQKAGSKGTAHCIKACQKADIDVWIYKEA